MMCVVDLRPGNTARVWTNKRSVRKVALEGMATLKEKVAAVGGARTHLLTSSKVKIAGLVADR